MRILNLLRSALLLVVAFGAMGRAEARETPKGFVLEITLANEKGGPAQLYYDIGQWYSGADSCLVKVPAGPTLHPYRFPIPAEPIKKLRFDPAQGKTVVRIGRIRLLTQEGAEVASISTRSLVPMHAIQSISWTGDIATVVTTDDYPVMLSIGQSVQRETEWALHRTFVPAGMITGLFAIVLAALALAVWAALASIPPCSAARNGSIVGVFLLVFGARLWWLLHYSRPMPFWDEWETDAIDLLIPLRSGYLDWQALFIPQGEHRILFTRLLNLVSTFINGEWDPRVGMVVGAALFAASLALVYAAAASFGKIRGLLLITALATWACFPFDLENIYWGDQTQMYALNLLAVVVIAVSVAERADRRMLAAALAAGLVSLFTMGSGLLAPLVGVGICAGRALLERRHRAASLKLGAVFLAVTLLGALLYREGPFYSPGYARTLGSWWTAFVGRAAWPIDPSWWGMLVTWLPWLALTTVMAASRQASKGDWIAWGLGAWALGNAMALAHGRPLDVFPFNTKYYTSMSMVVTAAALATVALGARMRRWTWNAVIAAPALYVLVAMHLFVFRGMVWSPDKLAARTADDNLVRPFLATGDPTVLRATDHSHLPYWNGAELAEILDSPQLQPILPAVLRTAAARRPGSPLPAAPTPGPLTMLVRALMKVGIYLSGLGALLLLALIAPAGYFLAGWKQLCSQRRTGASK